MVIRAKGDSRKICVCRTVDLPVSESPYWNQRDEREWVLQQEGVFPESSILFAELIVGLHPLGFQINPSPIDTEHHSDDRGKI
jgi:hypothetical protein